MFNHLPVEGHLALFGCQKQAAMNIRVQVSIHEFHVPGINAQAEALVIFDSCTLWKILICCAYWKPMLIAHKPNIITSPPHLNVYPYVNIMPNIENSQHLCAVHHMPVCIPSLLCMLTHLSSQQPYDVHTILSPLINEELYT